MRNHLLSGMALLSLVAAPVPAFASEAARPFSAPSDPDAFERALQCLTEAIYYEARSESDDGQRAVAQVVLNRVRHPSYPSSVCGVVYQGSHRVTGCQFTFTCDGSMNRTFVNGSAWQRAQRIAAAALRGNVYRPVGLALNYHTTAISPYWAPSLVPQTVVGAHIFYRSPAQQRQSFNQAYSATRPAAAMCRATPAPRRAAAVPPADLRLRGSAHRNAHHRPPPDRAPHHLPHRRRPPTHPYRDPGERRPGAGAANPPRHPHHDLGRSPNLAGPVIPQFRGISLRS